MLYINALFKNKIIIKPVCFRNVAYSVHNIYGACMRPETIMYRHKRNPRLFAIQARQHHMTRIQRMDEIRRKGVLLLQSIRLPANDVYLYYVCKFDESERE